MCESIQNSIAKGNLKQALRKCFDLNLNVDQLQTINLLQASHNGILRENRLGLLTFQDKNISCTNLTNLELPSFANDN